MFTRQIYGRPGFDLLRRRVPTTPPDRRLIWKRADIGVSFTYVGRSYLHSLENSNSDPVENVFHLVADYAGGNVADESPNLVFTT